MLKNKAGRAALIILSMVLAVAVVAGGCTSASETQTDRVKELKIGMSLVLTGPVASSVAPWGQVTLAYFKYVNDELGGIEFTSPDGKKDKVRLDIIWEDNAYSIPKALSIYKRQKEAGVMAVYMASTTPLEAVAGLASKDQIPILAHGNASPVAVGSKPNWVAVGYPSYADMAGAFLEWLKKDWKETRRPRVAFIWADTPSVRSGAVAMTPEIVAKYGFDFVGHEYISTAATDTTIEITRLHNAGTDFVYETNTVMAAAVSVKDMARLNINDMKLVHAPPNWDQTLITLSGAAAEGATGLMLTVAPDANVPGIQLANKIMRKYYDRDAGVLDIQALPTAIAFVDGLRQALSKTGYQGLTRGDIKDVFQNLKNLDTGGITSPLTIDPNWPVLNTRLMMSTFQGNKFVPLGDWTDAPQVQTRN